MLDMSALLPLLGNQSFRKIYIDHYLKTVTRACRDTNAHLVAKELVPLGEILQDNLEILDDESTYKDNLLPLVVSWFSSKFFKWFEAPNCEKCSNILSCRKVYTNAENKQVESYICDKDGSEFLFIRHDEPSILLDTRTGRCGEWAMCFFIILRALDYHARIVYDTTDHVWNEVWSETKKQFIHVDSCENTVESPLLYEVGWGKKLEYCFAMGQYEIQDVTKRYSIDFEKTLRRRTECDECWLSRCLEEITLNLVALAPSSEIRSTTLKRRSQDIEFLEQLKFPREIPDKGQLASRKTGSVQWRISRGEHQIRAKTHFVIKVKSSKSDEKDSSPIFAIHYNCDKNMYQSTSSDYDNRRNWSSLVYQYENLDFKYERDWKTSYVARYESCPYDQVGFVRWRFNLEEIMDIDWQTVEILISGKLYPGNSVSITLMGYNSEDGVNTPINKELVLNQSIKVKRAELGFETSYMDILASVSGGCEHDEVAWQKPQLFRQTKGDTQPAMSVEFY